MLGPLVAAFLSGETFNVARRAKRAAVAYLFAGIAMLAGVGFLVGAGYVWTARRYGTIEAAIAFGLGFLAIAVIIIAVHVLLQKSRATKAKDRRAVDLTTIASAAAITLLPTLARSKAGVGGLIVPALAALAYVIYREHSKPPPGGDAPD